ncbi:MAG: hypothetical protein GX603_03145 [Chloroflexi bacterium]|nr:hypothetical protein [Chloroflexota bacterium]
MNKKLGYIVLSIAFVLFNVIAFVVPTDKTPVFWIAYSFTVIAFAAQIFVWIIAFSNAETLMSKFLGLPIIHVGIVYLIVQLASFSIFLSLPWIAIWIPIIVCAVILGISGICLTTTEVGKEEVVRVEAKVQRKVSTIKGLQVDVELIAEAQTDAAAKEALKTLADKLKYSDPMSNESLASIEEEISVKISALKIQPTIDIPVLVKQIEMLLLERNKKSKLLK